MQAASRIAATAAASEEAAPSLPLSGHSRELNTNSSAHSTIVGHRTPMATKNGWMGKEEEVDSQIMASE
jgi:hypothetical protein